MKKLLLLIGVLALALLVGCTQTTAPAATDSGTQSAGVKVVENNQGPEQAPEFTVPIVDGQDFSLAQAKQEGKPTVIYFMASWCTSCAKNWKALNEVYPKYKDDVNFIAVSVDPTDTPEVLRELAIDKEFAFPTSPGNPQLAVDYNVKKQTAKFIIDADGNILSRHDGVLSAAEWDALFSDLAPHAGVQEAGVKVQEKSPGYEQAPEFTVELSSGETFSLADAKAEGKPTVVYFMASWCTSCAKNWKSINKVYPQYADDINLVGVSVDPTDSAKVLNDLADKKDFVFETSPGNPALAVDFNVKKQTAKFAIDADGNIILRHDGVLSDEEWKELFESLL